LKIDKNAGYRKEIARLRVQSIMG